LRSKIKKMEKKPAVCFKRRGTILWSPSLISYTYWLLLASRAAALLCSRCEMWSSKRDEGFLGSEYRCMGASPARSSIVAADLKLYDMAWDAARPLSVSGGGTDTGPDDA